jgi:hypothetical protein
MDLKPTTTAHEFKMRLTGFPITLPTGAIVQKRAVDLVTLVLSNALPSNLLRAASDMETVFLNAQDNKQAFDAIMGMSDQQRDEILYMLRRFAVECIVDPRFCMTEKDARTTDLVPVKVLTLEELLVIFNTPLPRNAPIAIPDPPVMEAQELAEFRAPDTTDVDSAARDGEVLRAAAEQLTDGGVAEFSFG